jgi:uncharacterized repeat protein (TIGR03803 family)
MKRPFSNLCAGVVGCALALQFPAAADAGSKERVLHSFNSGMDGKYPKAGLVDVAGTLYGMTEVGGTHNGGAVFSVNPTTGVETLVYSFAGEPDGDFPLAGLIDVNGMLYGTTANGGDANKGTAFSVNPTTGAETVLHSFDSASDGQIPVAGLIDVKGMLYGTTEYGGTVGAGTVFSLNPTTGTETVLHSFGGAPDGTYPVASLINVKGRLYGTTEIGGTNGSGTVFSLDLKTGAEKVLYSFSGGTDGEYPEGNLIDVNGTLYGTAGLGGAYNYGNVFSLNPTTGAETVLYSFRGGTDGVSPVAGLIDVKGTLYGTTEAGGAHNYGTVFSVNLTTGAETVLYTFGGRTDGGNPYPGLVKVMGKLYGTTYFGGTYNYGTVFEIRKP